MIRASDPRSVIRFVSIYAYIEMAIHLVNLFYDWSVGVPLYIIVDIISASVSLVSGLIFYLFSIMKMPTLIKYRHVLWVPTVLLFFSDILCAIITVVMIFRVVKYIGLISARIHTKSQEAYAYQTNNEVINVECEVVGSSSNYDDTTVLKNELDRLNHLKEDGIIDEEEYKRLKDSIVNKYIGQK